MFFGVNTFLWTHAFTVRDLPLLEKLKSWNADSVEFAVSDIERFPRVEVRRELERLDLSCTVCTSPPSIELGLIHDDPDARRAGVGFLQSAIDLASDLGSKIVAGPIYAKVAWFTGQRPTPFQFERAVDAIGDLTMHLDASGIDLAIEPMNRFETFFLPTAAEGVRLCEAIAHRRVGLMLDTAHMVIEEKDVLAAIRTAGSRLKHMQVADNDRGTPGAGTLVDWKGIFTTLEDIKYEGGCAIESFAFQDPFVSSRTWCWRDLASSQDELARDGLAFLRATHGSLHRSSRSENPCS